MQCKGTVNTSVRSAIGKPVLVAGAVECTDGYGFVYVTNCADSVIGAAVVAGLVLGNVILVAVRMVVLVVVAVVVAAMVVVVAVMAVVVVLVLVVALVAGVGVDAVVVVTSRHRTALRVNTEFRYDPPA